MYLGEYSLITRDVIVDMEQYIDLKAGLCGVAFCQVLPPMAPGVLRLHEEFQKAMFQRHGKAK